MERCLYCNEKMPLARSLAGNRFCGDEHQNEYRQRMEHSFLERLNRTRARPAAAPVPEPARHTAARDLGIRAAWDEPPVSDAKSPLLAKNWVRVVPAKKPALAHPVSEIALRRADPRAPWGDVYAASVAGLPPIPRSAIPPETFRPPHYVLRREFGRRQRSTKLRMCPPRPAWRLSAGTLFPESILMRLDLVLTPAGGLI